MQIRDSLTASPDAIRLHHADNVMIALRDLAAGSRPSADAPTLADPVPRGHKFALRDIAEGQTITKFGQTIACARAAIPAGTHVHDHNAAMPDYSGARPADTTSDWTAPELPARTSFEGYRRDTGKVGTRNYIAVVSTVNCSATVARHAAAEAAAELGILEDPDIDGIVAITHGAGCGMAGSGDSFDMLQRTIWGYVTHPNMALVVLVGLGCEVMQVRTMTEAYGMTDSDRIRTLTIQQTGGTRRTIERIKAVIAEALPVARVARRETVPVSELKLALQCGGSDGYSGVTANPALGLAADRLVAAGGTVILSETPEIYGAEHLLMARARSRQVAEALAERIAWWEDYTARNGGQMNNNPTPGNKRGGLTTILEKSLGAVAKAGTSPLEAVLRYGEPVRQGGFVFMDSPGYDPVSITGQVASGANVICFTTGRGSVYGCKPVPSLKFASNSEMFATMEEDMDMDCGRILSVGQSLDAMAEEILDMVIDTASGRRSKSERSGLGDSEFVPWITGAVM